VADVDDPFRRGMLRIGRATAEAEREWLKEAITGLERSASAV
jgi:hypothetical protein